MKQITLKQIGFIIRGTALINLWGGGQGTIDMDSTFVPIEKLTKDNILRCVNDGKFGCESIEAADIDIYDAFEHGHKEFNRTICATKIHSPMFLGWRELREQGIKC